MSEPSAARLETMVLLVLVPLEHTHAPRSILEQSRKLGPDVTAMRATKHTRRRSVCGFIVDWKPILTDATFGCKTSASCF